MKNLIRKFIRRRRKWSIGIYLGSSPFNLNASKKVKNPVLKPEDITDVCADFVADPFMVREQNHWYMFFEVFNALNRQGEIGLAISQDGLNWTYQQIVLRETFHLSYPYTFKWQGNYYMIPESSEDHTIRLYQATQFPTHWTFKKNLLQDGDYVDSSIFYFNRLWWLFTTSRKCESLRLYYALDPMQDWTEHPKSPVIQGDLKSIRPGGRVIVNNNKVFRYAQDIEHIYGKQLRAFEITVLTTTEYQEKAVQQHPVLKPGWTGWNSTGMHNIDPHQIDQDQWIACVDGYKFLMEFGKV